MNIHTLSHLKMHIRRDMITDYEQGVKDGRAGRSHGFGYDDSSEYEDYFEVRYIAGYEEGYEDGYREGSDKFNENEYGDGDDDEEDDE